MNDIEFTILNGKILTKVSINDEQDEIVFTTDSGERFKMYHYQDCCERVTIQDITGSLDDIIGSQILLAEEVTSLENPTDIKTGDGTYQDSFMWTFYKLATVKGRITIRWYGESNGYYSESVDFDLICEKCDSTNCESVGG